MERGRRTQRRRVTLPEGTVDLVGDVVPAVRALLRRGLDRDFLETSVRIGAFEPFGGGLKSPLVGGLRVDVNAALKLGDEELELVRLLVERVNRVQPRTFPAIQSLVALEDGRRLVFMEQLLGHETLLSLVYCRPTALRELAHVVERVFELVRGLRRAYRAEPRAFRGIPRTADPYAARLRDRLGRAIDGDRALAPLRSHDIEVDGQRLPPLGALLEEIAAWTKGALAAAPRALCHGDLHLGNVMARRRGSGWSVRLIDPTPTVGVSDPLYDAGKLLHWAEPVGWARIAPERCGVSIRTDGGGVRLRARLRGVSASAERRRAALAGAIRARLCASSAGLRRSDPTREARLELSVAAAHAGMAAILATTGQEGARRFALAHALRALARWRALAGLEP